MGTNPKNNFKEARLGPDFASDKLKEFKTMIDAGISFVAMSMPGVGASYFLKYLCMQNLARSPSLRPSAIRLEPSGDCRAGSGVSGRAYFIHVDLYELPSLTQHEFYRLLLMELSGKPGTRSDDAVFSESKNILKKLSESQEKIVIIFSRFDQLKKEFDWNFLSNIQSLTMIAPGKIVLIFTSVKPLNETAPEAVSGGNLNFFSKDLYFKPFESSDLKKLFLLDHTLKAHPHLDDLINLSGGHIQLFNILLNSHKQQNLMLDQFVKQQMKSLVGYLDYQQSKQVQKIALGKSITEVDEYLLGVGMVKEVGNHFELFTPLLSQYIKENIPIKLPAKEAKLFKLLRSNMGEVVSKDQIFSEVWPARLASESVAGRPDDEGATDWALDALIYRLRKHPFMLSHGYIIESNKKVGYTLIQS